ncbi:NAD-dependent epimerase/dehydratase family protein [Metabacillus indicus]|uniref:UDP-glucose 4-epimerase n=1 Tax=Metabacillus indicus TaxID=246786 RepID=A0A084GXU9_METID|nr:NAD-dependent epimerase/dehydratase family protein [Metabacillus indicus]KEZ52161.1 UDP-glucose 4-epimerase [Metabacillus indicus]
MKVLVTGGAGFVGSHLVDEYIKNGYETVVVDSMISGNHLHLNSKAVFYEADICSEDFKEIVKKEKPDFINHHAANINVQSSIKNPDFDARVNILGTINVLESCVLLGGIPIIYPSSAAIYGTPKYLAVDEEHPINPISNYGISKYTPEQYIRVYHELYDIPYSILRYSNVYGPRQNSKGEGGVVSILLNSVLESSCFTKYGKGDQTRDFIHVKDVVNANIKATETILNTAVNISNNKQTSLNELINLFMEVSNKDLRVFEAEERTGDIKYSCLSNEKASLMLGWRAEHGLLGGISELYELNKTK